MLQHVDADHGIEGRIGVGQGLAHALVIADRQPFGRGMGPRAGHRRRRRVDPRHHRPAPRQRLGHEAARAAEVEHGAARPVRHHRLEMAQPGGHHVGQHAQPARAALPPVAGDTVVKGDVFGAHGGLLAGLSRS